MAVTPTPRRPRRLVRARRDERGAALVEAAIVLPLLMLMIFGVLEMGMLFRNYLSVTHMARDGARSASAAGNDYDADFRAVSTMKGTSDVVTNGTVMRVVIFDASKDRENAQVPEICKTADPTNPSSVNPVPTNFSNNLFKHDSQLTTAEAAALTRCNIYLPTTWIDGPRYGCDTLGGGVDLPDYDLNWCPRIRDVSVRNGIDYVGVYVEMEHRWITGLFGSQLTITDTTVVRIEPKEF